MHIRSVDGWRNFTATRAGVVGARSAYATELSRSARNTVDIPPQPRKESSRSPVGRPDFASSKRGRSRARSLKSGSELVSMMSGRRSVSFEASEVSAQGNHRREYEEPSVRALASQHMGLGRVLDRRGIIA